MKATGIVRRIDDLGTVAFFSPDYPTETELKMAQAAALYLGKQFEN